MYFTYLIEAAPAHISFTLGVSSGGCERQRCLRGTNEQFGVDQTAETVTAPGCTVLFSSRLSFPSLENSWETNQECCDCSSSPPQPPKLEGFTRKPDVGS